MSTLKAAIFEHATQFELALDDKFITAIVAGVKGMGVLNPKVPDPFSQAGMKTLSPKVPAAASLPGISPFSVPVRQKYDWSGGAAVHMRAFRFICTPFQFDGAWHAVADLVEPVQGVMAEVFGDDWGMAAAAIRAHLTRLDQHPMIHNSEKQILWAIDVLQDRFLSISPQHDLLNVELAARLRERKARPTAQVFNRIYLPVSSDKFQNAGIAACGVAGHFPKLMCLPPIHDSQRAPTALPTPEPGRLLALEFDCQHMNATGGGIVAGLTSVTQSVGFQEAFRRGMLKRGKELAINAIAVGFSHVRFNGECQNGEWLPRLQMGTRPNHAATGGATMKQIVVEFTASARVHVILELQEAVLPDFLDAAANVAVGMRFGGGAIFNARATLVNDAENLMQAWGDEVHFLADRQDEIANEADKLDAALDRLHFYAHYEDDAAESVYRTPAPGYCLALTGYQGVEPPRPRNGVRNPEYRHIYAASLVTLAQWQAASIAADDKIFWYSTWNRVTYAAVAQARGYV